MFGKENEPECQQNRIVSRSLSGKTVRCSSNRFVQVHSPLTRSLISGNFSKNLGVLDSMKGVDSPEHFKGETELNFGLFKRHSFSPPTSK